MCQCYVFWFIAKQNYTGYDFFVLGVNKDYPDYSFLLLGFATKKSYLGDNKNNFLRYFFAGCCDPLIGTCASAGFCVFEPEGSPGLVLLKQPGKTLCLPDPQNGPNPVVKPLE